ncbi:hypothetical protein DPMN_076074 [Dreissena polymorpha]|uniref:Uncharacterized protein n=1 Tax=Dreissena polymorpha TaxID=45954 RepID=A0A9D3YLP6_DREPO|nr:hypothetical protein DPMN_076074 [Dreissena polymorpha]
MLNNLKWQTSEQRQNISNVILLYKIQNNLVWVDYHHLTPTRNLNYLVPYSRTQYHSNSFFPRSIRLWNGLPVSLQASPSIGILILGSCILSTSSKSTLFLAHLSTTCSW